jgi:hypothetical protein
MPSVLDEIDILTGSRVRSITVAEKASDIALSADRSQAYVYHIGGLDTGYGKIQRVSTSSLAIEATYTVPLPSNSFISDIEVNPENPNEIIVLCRTPDGRTSLGPICYRNDELLPAHPTVSSTSPAFVTYLNQSTVWGTNLNNAEPTQTTFSVSTSGVAQTSSTNRTDIDINRFKCSGTMLIGRFGKTLSFPSLTVVNDLMERPNYNTMTQVPATVYEHGWYVGQRGASLSFGYFSARPWKELASASMILASDEAVMSLIPLGDTRAICVTTERVLDLDLE